jgi:hypothetical protein
VAALVVAVATIVILVTGVLKPSAPRQSAGPPLALTCPVVDTVRVGYYLVPSGPIAGYCQPQLINAAQILNAARKYGLPERAREIGVMTAIGESGLRNLDFGDKAGPDSRGIFQQRANWGPVATRMNPLAASESFFGRLIGLPGWNTLPPTAVAHAVQANADPNYYTKFWSRAQTLVVGLEPYLIVKKPAGVR